MKIFRYLFKLLFWSKAVDQSDIDTEIIEAKVPKEVVKPAAKPAAKGQESKKSIVKKTKRVYRK